MTMDRRLIFLDTETTGLNRRTRRIWDLAYIIRDPGQADVEWQCFLPVDLSEADPFALKIGGYYDRHPQPHCLADDMVNYEIESGARVAAMVATHFRDAIIVGAVPSFDEETLANLLHENHLATTWHHHLVDVETLAAGALKMAPPWNFDAVLAAYGLTCDEADRHTALGDARMVRDLYDAILKDAP